MVRLFCRACSIEAFKTWEGWPTEASGPDLSPLKRCPPLPRLKHGVCQKCGGTSVLRPSHIRYINVHGEGNTGLPDHFALTICRPGSERYDFLSRWGNPYCLTDPPATASIQRPLNDRQGSLRIVGRPRKSSGQQSLDFDL